MTTNDSPYHAEFSRASNDPESFWAEQSAEIAWFEAPQTVLAKDENDNDAWFTDGVINSSYLALDYQIESGRGDQVALIYDSPVTDVRRQYTFNELRDRVALFAGVLTNLGVVTGDRVIIYMPMMPEAAIAMLACARIGAIHSVVFGGFAAKELATRIDDASPKVILAASCGIEFANTIAYKPLIDEACKIASHDIEHCVVFQREQCVAALDQARDRDWTQLLEHAEPVAPIPLASNHPLYILYTSGTTGKPKGVVRDNGGHAVALNYSMKHVYDVSAGDVFWAASDVGWVVGHSFIVYGPLMAGCTSVMFEGKPVRTPDAGTFWRVIADYGVNVFFTAPTAFRAIRKEDPDAKLLDGHDLSQLRSLFVAGERTDPATFNWLVEKLKVPVIDHWWQTETGWPVASVCLGLESFEPKAGSVSLPVPGYDVKIVSEDCEELARGEQGAVVITLPLPPGCLPTVWGDHERYVESYLTEYPGFYHTGDGGYIDEDGFIFIMGRTDDVINVAGHRLSTGQMEEVVADHPAIAECAVVGIEDRDKGQVPVGLVIVKDGVNIDLTDLQGELVAMVRGDVGAFANFRRIVQVARLPKTRSGKILRRVIRNIVDAKPFETPATIDDPAILQEIADVFIENGIGILAEQKEQQ